MKELKSGAVKVFHIEGLSFISTGQLSTEVGSKPPSIYCCLTIWTDSFYKPVSSVLIFLFLPSLGIGLDRD